MKRSPIGSVMKSNPIGDYPDLGEVNLATRHGVRTFAIMAMRSSGIALLIVLSYAGPLRRCNRRLDNYSQLAIGGIYAMS
ncbi:MAG TPA: hypothetical protein VGL94_09490 [Ktedonobacteraceae bacterium]|jgi:hypothetical protein